MKKLVDLVKIVENNAECVILEVVGKPIDLIKLGCFNGDETIFRLTKGKDHTCTVWTSNGKNFSWYWGINGYTLVTDRLDKMGRLIQECIEQDFEIYIRDNKDLIRKTLNINSIYDVANNKHKIKLMYFNSSKNNICCHMDGDYYSSFANLDKAIKHFKDKGYTFKAIKDYVAQNGCIVEEYKISR